MKARRVITEGTHFRYEDGGYYYPFGTTVYALIHQADELVEQTLVSLKNSPFNKVRMCVFPKHYEYNRNEPPYFPFEKKTDGSWDLRTPCEAFWNRLDRLVGRLGEMGIQVDLILFHPYDRWGFAKLTMEEKKQYLRMAVEHLGHWLHLWWSLANEYDVLPGMEERDWKELEKYLAQLDHGRHLLSNHNWGRFYDFKSSAVTHVCVQSSMVHEVAKLQQKYQKPVIYDEMCYEGNVPQGWGNLSAFELVNRFWCVVSQGGYATHGECFMDENDVLWWAKGGVLKGESPERIAWLREITESFPSPLEPVEMPRMGGAETDMDEEDKKRMFDMLPEEVRMFAIAASKLDNEDKFRMELSMASYEGHCGNEVFLKYFARTCPCSHTLELPEDGAYRIEVLDVWNMTRRVAFEKACGTVQVPLPAKEGMALLAVKRRKI